MITPEVTLIDGFVLLGIAVVLPLALGGRWWWWAGAAVAAYVAFVEPAGWQAGVLAGPLLAACVAAAVVRLRTFDGLGVLAGAYASVGAASLLQSRLGADPFGIGEPIVELTAIHYVYAGAGALVLAGEALARAGAGRRRRVARAAVAFTAVAPPVVALGFLAGEPLPQVGGAVLMTVGVWLTGSLHLCGAWDRGAPVASRFLLGLSGVAIWLPMVLAVAWAAGQHWSTPALSIHDMARTHGAANAIAFITAGLVARRVTPVSAPDRTPTPAGG